VTKPPRPPVQNQKSGGRSKEMSHAQGRGSASATPKTSPAKVSPAKPAQAKTGHLKSADRPDHPHGQKSRHKPPHGPARSNPHAGLIYGTHAVRAALQSGRREILNLFASPQAAQRFEAEFAAAGFVPQIVSNEDLARRLGPQAVHQGLLLEAKPLETIDLSDIETRSGIVLALDQITDPHNVGAIVRTAAAFEVDAIVTTERHSPEFSGLIAKIASGGLDFVPIAVITNFARGLERLADLGYLRVGLDSEAPIDFTEAPLTRPVVLVLGGEGKGLRRLSRENCDVLARLDMPGPIKSLNVSNACAVALTLTRLKLSAG